MERRLVQTCKGTNNSKWTMKQITYILFLLLFLPQIASAQSKPKRDTSKDKSVIVAKQKKEQTQKRTALIAERKKKQIKSRKYHRKQPIVHTATYLRVNQFTSLSKVLEPKGGAISFDVATDGNEWSVSDLPYWCKVTKYSNWFVVNYDSNPTHEDRQSWFDVRSDNQQVRINVTQQGAPINIHAKFNYAYLLHNQYVASLGNCLKITSEVTISGTAGQKCWVEAFIVDEDGYNVNAKNGYQNYALPSSNNLYVASEIVPSTDNEETFKIVSYIPNNAMNLLRKNNKLQCKLAIYCINTNEYVSGATYTMKFRAKSKHGVVTTKYSK